MHQYDSRTREWAAAAKLLLQAAAALLRYPAHLLPRWACCAQESQEATWARAAAHCTSRQVGEEGKLDKAEAWV
jgi:hypothetical protein